MTSRDAQFEHAQLGQDHSVKMELPEDRQIENKIKGAPVTRAPRIKDLDSASEILESMKHMTTGAADMGRAAEVMTEMFQNSEVVLTLSGVASVGKLDLIIAELIDAGIIKVVVATGAVITHGCSHEMGGKMFHIPEDQVNQDVDVDLYNRGMNRVFDTVELESSLEATGDMVTDILERDFGNRECVGSYEIHCAMGAELNKEYPQPHDGILHAAHRMGVPVIVPAFTDSEIGLSVMRYLTEHDQPFYDAFRDFDVYSEFAKQASESGKSLGILTLGGGVPRNWAQQIGPYFDTLTDRKMIELKKPVRFKYAVRICPEFTNWGGLSGCTYSEGISWGKFIPEKEGGKFAEVYADYTHVFPLLIRGVMERIKSKV
jgi:deoxyhypusine synthase